MRLYHGTSARHLDSILSSGLTPRGDGRSNWNAASSADKVYLTRCYGLYFANNARLEATEDLLIVEIDTDLLPDRDRLLADEDAAWYAWSKGHLGRLEGEQRLRALPVERQAEHFAALLPQLAEDGFDHATSLDILGNCAHAGPIPICSVSRILRYDGVRPWWLAFHDPVISPLNFLYTGAESVATQLVVADRLEEARAVELPVYAFIDLDAVEELCAANRTTVFERTPASGLTP